MKSLIVFSFIILVGQILVSEEARADNQKAQKAQKAMSLVHNLDSPEELTELKKLVLEDSFRVGITSTKVTVSNGKIDFRDPNPGFLFGIPAFVGATFDALTGQEPSFLDHFFSEARNYCLSQKTLFHPENLEALADTLLLRKDLSRELIAQIKNLKEAVGLKRKRDAEFSKDPQEEGLKQRLTQAQAKVKLAGEQEKISAIQHYNQVAKEYEKFLMTQAGELGISLDKTLIPSQMALPVEE